MDTRINELYSDLDHNGGEVSIRGRYYLTLDSLPQRYADNYDVFPITAAHPITISINCLEITQAKFLFAEPTLIYSNVKGGFGCFGAYTQSRYRYKKKRRLVELNVVQHVQLL